MRLTFVTGSQLKLKEARAILSRFGVDNDDLDNEDLEIRELQGSRETIIRAKAGEAAERMRRPFFVEDTSLCIDKLGGLPGPYIRAFVEAFGIKASVDDKRSTPSERRAARMKLVQLLQGFPGGNSAQAICMVVYCEPGAEPKCFEGVTTGTIVEPRGDTGYWDPVFQPDGYQQTYAEMAEVGGTVKNEVSHRRRALEKLGEHLRRQRLELLGAQRGAT